MTDKPTHEERLFSALSYPFWYVAFPVFLLSKEKQASAFTRMHCHQGLFLGLLLWGGGAMLIFHGLQPARKWDKYTMPAFGAVFLLAGFAFLIPFLQPVLLPLFWFVSKVGILLFLFIWVRATLPRFRYDQLMRFAWAFMFPVSVVHLFATALLVALLK